jgi:hypothetical protein
MNPARYMWISSCHRFALKRAERGWTSVTSPFAARVKPCGLFIHPLTAITDDEPTIPASATGKPLKKWARGERRSQP